MPALLCKHGLDPQLCQVCPRPVAGRPAGGSAPTWSPLGQTRAARPTFYLNNHKRIDHRAVYEREDAFFDLGTAGAQADQVADIRVGDTCIVATPAADRQFTFAWFTYARVELLPNTEELLPNKDALCRVLCGPAVKTQTFLQADASRQSVYAPFFDKSGHFKQQLVIRR